MPFTPYHFGPHACAALPFGSRIDLPVFLLANVAVDIEPLMVMTFGLDYPLHGYCHTLLIGAGVGAVAGLSAWPFRGLFRELMKVLRLPYRARLSTMVLSGVLGVWLHVLFDSVIYADIRPLWPLFANPVRGILTSAEVYRVCRVCFLVAVLLYVLLAALRSLLSRRAGNIPGPVAGPRLESTPVGTPVPDEEREDASCGETPGRSGPRRQDQPGCDGLDRDDRREAGGLHG